ncbi:MAG: hypothetical protein B6I38_05295 [Anaerolineaceae bacterium 4572_5.1]|nr:MAG: hypothetical protein B6I38_05295 [Anaerolineaceae bacterium 4572_5.1]
MAKRNPSRRRKKRAPQKKSLPGWMIFLGAGLIILGVAAMIALPQEAPEEYSSVPVPVEYPAPELTLENLQGETESLADYRGQVVLVNLWATWCPPCKAELPVLQSYYEDHVVEGFSIIGINFGESHDEVDAFIKTTDLTYPIWIDIESASGLAFNSFSLPSSFVIDRTGTVRLAWTGAISQKMLEKHLTPIIAE